ncbi:MAG TPA: YdaU family protein [Candidatus Aphodousia faecalis]|nr:YdaU family protein [Candidatus Aphodousia faecalis]
MIYFRFHIGDWEQKTRLLSPIEKGIYVDLLTYYYSTEHPIVRSNYERITRGYTEEEKKAADYVLSTFFTEKDGCYYNKRCEEEIAAWQEKSSKSKKSIKARWDREKKRIPNNRKDSDEQSDDDSIEDTNVCANEDTNVCTNDDTDGILTINHKPLTNISSITSKDVIVETAVSDPPASESEKVEKPKGIDCPYKELVAAYNAILGPYLGMCQKLTPTRQKAVQARWRDCMKDGDFKTQDEGIAYFKRYFEYIKTCDFLMGNNGRDWRADFDWIFKLSNYTKICEGKYLSR